MREREKRERRERGERDREIDRGGRQTDRQTQRDREAYKERQIE